MKTIFGVSLCLAVVAALPIEIFEDDSGQEFAVLPVHREKRDLAYGANQDSYSLGQKGTLYDGDSHRFDGSYSASKAWDSHGIKPDSYNGRVDYTNKPTGSGAFVSADRIPGYGTDVNAGLKYNIAQGKDWGADVTGQYGRHFGGPGGTGKPEGGVFLNFEGKI